MWCYSHFSSPIIELNKSTALYHFTWKINIFDIRRREDRVIRGEKLLGVANTPFCSILQPTIGEERVLFYN